MAVFLFDCTSDVVTTIFPALSAASEAAHGLSAEGRLPFIEKTTPHSIAYCLLLIAYSQPPSRWGR